MLSHSEDVLPVVLVAADETVMRVSTAIMLRDAGFATAEALSFPDAMQTMERIPAIKVVLADIMMPSQFDGITLACCIRYRWPKVGLVLFSGNIKLRPGELPLDAHIFSKTYRQSDITAAVNTLMFNKTKPV